MQLTIGQYFPGNSFVHRLDPRTKLLLTIALIAAVFVAHSVIGYAVLYAFVLAVIYLSKISIKYVVRGLKPILFIVIFTFLLNVFFTGGGNVIFTWKFISITDTGVLSATKMALRLILLVAVTQLLTLTTSSIALTDGLETLTKPLEKLHFPSHEMAMMMSIALRFIPTLMEETDKIMKAQQARGADFSSGGLVKRAKALLPLLIPLFVGAFRRADELAMAMEARCYRGGNGRTRMKQLIYSKLDLQAAICVLVLIVIIALV